MTMRVLVAGASGTLVSVAKSMVLVHGFGDFGVTPLTEDAPLRTPGRTEAALVKALRDLEWQIVDAARWRIVAPSGSRMLSTESPPRA